MNTFFKTFFICLVLTFSFLAYKFFATDSYDTQLNVSKNNPVFGVHQEIKDAPAIEKKEVLDTLAKTVSETPKVQEKYDHKCYFYSNSGDLTLIERKLSFKPSLENSIAVLLKGPTIQESKKGIYSEIPANVDLIKVIRNDNKVIVDLSSNFGNGGGSKSIENRVKQLSKTIKLHYPDKNIYLYINGKEVEYLGGDGVYIKQPLD